MQAVVQVVLFGLSLSLSMLNGVESDCNYFQNLEAGQTYYVYNPEYPNEYHGENHCIWKMASPYNTKIACSIEMSNINCSQGRLSILFADGKVFNYCGKNTVVLNGINPTIKFDSRYNSNGRFLCQIQTSNNNNNCNCGWKKVTRIVGGKTTEVNEYPMMCGLVDSVNKIIYCGCTIISEEYIITAAHCIEGRQFSLLGVVVGEHDTATGKETNATRLFRLVGCIIHPGYKSNRDAINDVAVCKIAGKIEYNAQVGPVCLPFQHKEDSCAGYIVTALGWGLEEFTGQKSDTLQEVDLNVITLGNCKKYYPDDGINYSNMCTYTPGKDTCQMDSGGPLLWQDPKTHKLVLVGITSSGVGCASDTPAVAMRTGAFIDWIVSITPDAQYCQIE